MGGHKNTAVVFRVSDALECNRSSAQISLAVEQRANAEVCVLVGGEHHQILLVGHLSAQNARGEEVTDADSGSPVLQEGVLVSWNYHRAFVGPLEAQEIAGFGQAQQNRRVARQYDLS